METSGETTASPTDAPPRRSTARHGTIQPIDRHLAAVMNEAREKSGLTVVALAELIGMHVSKTSAKMNGRRAAYVHDVYAVALATGVPASRMMREAEKRVREERNRELEQRAAARAGDVA